MRVIAYSDAHFGLPKTLEILELNPNYENCCVLAEIINREKPDLVISVGDFSELLYEKGIDYGACFRMLKDVTDIFLAGNHDPYLGLQEYFLDDVKYFHGKYRGCANESREAHIKDCRVKAQNDPFYVVMGHTHEPLLGEGFLDIGSITLTGTFAEIINGEAKLRSVKVTDARVLPRYEKTR